MSEAMKAIVGGYVRLADRGALEGLEAHRRLLLLAMRSNGDAELNAPMTRVIAEEIAIIEAGLQKSRGGRSQIIQTYADVRSGRYRRVMRSRAKAVSTANRDQQRSSTFRTIAARASSESGF
jgi:hypothetical protein